MLHWILGIHMNRFLFALCYGFMNISNGNQAWLLNEVSTGRFFSVKICLMVFDDKHLNQCSELIQT